jgi:hypothetical protein
MMRDVIGSRQALAPFGDEMLNALPMLARKGETEAT